MTQPGPAAQLCEEILAEGRRRAEELREEARKSGEGLLAKASSEAEALRSESLETAQREAARRRERILADLPVELARRRAARVEALLESLRKGALRRLVDRRGFDYREALLFLAAEALGRMRGETFVLGLAPGDVADNGLVEEILRRAGRPGLTLTQVEDPSIMEGGLILRDAEGRQLWDDRLPVRLERLWPALRLPLARGAGLLGAS